METFRYGLAVLLVCTLPPFLLYWPIVHGFIRFWRRRGTVLTFVVVVGGLLIAVVALFRVRDELLLVDYGTNWALVAGGVGLLIAASWLRLRIQRDFPNAFLVGLPELDPGKHPQQLVRAGLHKRVRHPRYLQFLIALGGYTLIANYLGAYLIWLLWIPGVYVTVLFEERELRSRFGEDYERYCREVPRFIPRFRGTVD